MKLSINGLHLISNFEGCRLATYHDIVGVPTIGFGHTGKDVKEGMRITQQQAYDILEKDTNRFVDAVNELVTVTLNQNQFDALVSFAFNLGSGALKTSTLLKKVNAKDFVSASKEFLKWNHAGGKVVAGLTRRRQTESDLFSKPAPVLRVNTKKKVKTTAKPKGDMETASIVDYLVSIKEDASFKHRAELAKKHGIEDYKGTVAQNKKLLTALRK